MVNRVGEVGFRQTTALLVASLVRRHCEVYLANVDAVSFASHEGGPGFFAECIRVLPSEKCDSNEVEATAKSALTHTQVRLGSDDVILIRTNPGRDLDRMPVHDTFLDVCRAAKLRGIGVINDPDHLQFFASKASLAAIDPNYCPPMMVSHSHSSIVEFVKSSNCDCVIKPLAGSRGQDVIRVNGKTDDLLGRVAKTFGQRGLVAQHFVDADQPGDKRVVVVNGEILRSGDELGGIERHPATNDFRANLHAGGTAHRLTLTKSEREAAEYAAELLNANGIWLAGVDLIADKIIEFNVFSTGGLFDAIRFSGIDFGDVIVDRFLADIKKGRPT